MANAILIDPARDPRWDRFVKKHPFGWITHLSGWKGFQFIAILANHENNSFCVAKFYH
jgi:hypothetical protein